MDLSNLPGLLTALIFPVFFINYLVQNYLDNQTWWENIPRGRQSVFEFIASLIIAVLAYAALHLLPDVPASWLTQINALYPIIYSLVAAWLGGQIGHQIFVRGELRMAQIKASKKSLLPNG